MCEQTGRCDSPSPPPPRRNAFSQRGRLLHCAEWARSRGQPIHFISGRNQRTVGEKERAQGKNILSTQGDSAHRYKGKLRIFFSLFFLLGGGFTCSRLCMCKRMRQHLVTQRAGTVADRREVRHEHFHTHTDTHVSHLLVVAQLIVQDDAVGLLRLRP